MDFMVLQKEELVLFAISLIKEDERPNVRFRKEQLANALDINATTLDLYLGKLKKAGCIERHKKKYVEDVRQTYDILDQGRERFREILSNIEKENLTPERHNIPSIVPVSRILTRIGDPLEKIFFLALYSKVIRFDLPFYLETIKTAKEDSNIVNVLSEAGEETPLGVPIVETFFKTCFFGDVNSCMLEELASKQMNVNTLLLVAEASYKQARFDEAMSIYDHLLSGKVKVTQNQWFMARIGKALLRSKMGNTETSIKELDELEDQVDNKVFKAFAKQVKARILSNRVESREESLELFNSAIRSFRAFGFPLLLCIGHNNRGILRFHMNDLKEAENDWNLARKYSREARSKYTEAATLTNLSDIEMLRGNLEKSNRYLKTAKELFHEVGDLERVAIVDFNYALLELEKRNFEKAMEFFRRSETLAYPSPSPEERRIRREIFRERSLKYGFPEFEFDK
ncbi:MAG: tetratricopeptide repeat protein [Candidatus Thermoplasmatota archaeon]|nr:tetratricopeptide repeat protein [Candidatus Thermoplasmatota archaeon]